MIAFLAGALVFLGLYAGFSTYCLFAQLRRVRQRERKIEDLEISLSAARSHGRIYEEKYRSLKTSSDELEAQWLQVSQPGRDQALASLTAQRREADHKIAEASAQVRSGAGRAKASSTPSRSRSSSSVDAAVSSSTTAAIIAATSAACF